MLLWTKTLLPVLMISILLGCGKKEEEQKHSDVTGTGTNVPAIVFPTDGLHDLVSTPAGAYMASRIRSYSFASEKNMKALFDHPFAAVGNPKNGDPVVTKTDWGSVVKGDEKVQLQAEVNLPLRIEANGTSIEFKRKFYYWHYTRSNGGWQWSISGDEDPSGIRFHEVFKPEFKRRDTPAVYGNELVRSTAKLNGNQLLIYYEIKILGEGGAVKTQQVVEITYLKQ